MSQPSNSYAIKGIECENHSPVMVPIPLKFGTLDRLIVYSSETDGFTVEAFNRDVSSPIERVAYGFSDGRIDIDGRIAVSENEIDIFRVIPKHVVTGPAQLLELYAPDLWHQPYSTFGVSDPNQRFLWIRLTPGGVSATFNLGITISSTV